MSEHTHIIIKWFVYTQAVTKICGNLLCKAAGFCQKSHDVFNCFWIFGILFSYCSGHHVNVDIVHSSKSFWWRSKTMSSCVDLAECRRKSVHLLLDALNICVGQSNPFCALCHLHKKCSKRVSPFKVSILLMSFPAGVFFWTHNPSQMPLQRTECVSLYL